MPDDITLRELDRRILRAAHELEALGVNVHGFLEQAVDGEKQARDLHSPNPRSPIEPEAFPLLADELHGDLERSLLLFSPSVLWSVHRLRLELWNGEESKEREATSRHALAQLADALADRRTGTHGRPKPGGAKIRSADSEAVVSCLAELASGAVRVAISQEARPEESPRYYERLLVRARFWHEVNLDDPPGDRLHDIFDWTPNKGRPSLAAVVAAMVAALMGGDVDPDIFGGPGEPDQRATARSLAIRALRKVRPENLEIPKR